MDSSEIRQHEFRKVLRGFDPREVTPFLDRVASDVEALRGQNGALKIALEELEKELERYRQMEQTIQQTLIQAQQTTEKYVANAKQYEEQTRKEAEEQAAVIIEESHRKVLRLKEEVEVLQLKRNDILKRLKLFLHTEMESLQSMTSSTTGEEFTSEEEAAQYHGKEIEEIINVLVG